MKYFVWFKEIDTLNNGHLTLNEFKLAKDMIEEHWNETIDSEVEFYKIDENRSGII